MLVPGKNNGCYGPKRELVRPSSVHCTDSLLLRTPISVTTKKHTRYTDSSFCRVKKISFALSYHGCNSCDPTILHVHKGITRCFVDIIIAVELCYVPVGIQLLCKLEISMGQEPKKA
jgi:hypothetical protein